MYPLILHHTEVMVVGISIISESEVSITVLCLTPFHSSTNQELFEKHVCIHSNQYEKYDGTVCPGYRLKLKYPLLFFVSYV